MELTHSVVQLTKSALAAALYFCHLHITITIRLSADSSIVRCDHELEANVLPIHFLTFQSYIPVPFIKKK